MYNLYNNIPIRNVTLCLSLCSFLFQLGVEGYQKVSLVPPPLPRVSWRQSSNESPTTQSSSSSRSGLGVGSGPIMGSYSVPSNSNEPYDRCDCEINVDQIVNYESLDSLLDNLMDLKEKYERVTGLRCDLSKIIKQTEKHLSKNGISLPRSTLKNINKSITQIKIQQSFLAKCVKNAMYEGFEGSAEHQNMHLIAKSASIINEPDPYAPASLKAAVLITACGILMLAIPCPLIEASGYWLINAGITAIFVTGLQSCDVPEKLERERKEQVKQVEKEERRRLKAIEKQKEKDEKIERRRLKDERLRL